jgi:hypothetical protein
VPSQFSFARHSFRIPNRTRPATALIAYHFNRQIPLLWDTSKHQIHFRGGDISLPPPRYFDLEIDDHDRIFSVSVAECHLAMRGALRHRLARAHMQHLHMRDNGSPTLQLFIESRYFADHRVITGKCSLAVSTGKPQNVSFLPYLHSCHGATNQAQNRSRTTSQTLVKSVNAPSCVIVLAVVLEGLAFLLSKIPSALTSSW